MASGVTWFNGPDKAATKFSMAADEVTENVADLVLDVLDTAQKRLVEIVDAGGINQTKKGGPRIISRKMRDSADADVNQSRTRVTGQFGFIDAPDYTLYQERGTKYIPSMLAFATAFEEAASRMQNELDSGKWFPTSLI